MLDAPHGPPASGTRDVFLARVLTEAAMVRLGYALQDVRSMTRDELLAHMAAMPLLAEREQDAAEAQRWFQQSLGAFPRIR